jgi:glycosyltransferase involved in cell wall biosynthesis
VFTGYVSDQDLCRIYNQASLFALPSLDEGFGLPALEAMACGVPVVASSGNALDEVVGDAGILVGPQDEIALAEAMDLILSDNALARTLSERSLERASQFSWDRAARDLVNLLHEMTLRFK